MSSKLGNIGHRVSTKIIFGYILGFCTYFHYFQLKMYIDNEKRNNYFFIVEIAHKLLYVSVL